MLMNRTHVFGAAMMAVALAVALAGSARAVDVDAGDYDAAPAGTNLAIGYAQFAHNDSFHPLGGATLKDNTSLDTQIGIARLVHYTSIGGVVIDPQILVPFGALDNAKVAGGSLGHASGLADPILAATLWVVNDPAKNAYVGITPFVWVPIGNYAAGKALNLGEHRWKGAVQAGVVQGVAPKIVAELYADTTFYGDNTDVGISHLTLTQHESYQVQGWLRYDFSPLSHVALGYDQTLGGKQFVAGISTGQETKFSQVRVNYAQMVSSSLQLSATLARDVAASGGFEESWRVNLRVLKLF